MRQVAAVGAAYTPASPVTHRGTMFILALMLLMLLHISIQSATISHGIAAWQLLDRCCGFPVSQVIRIVVFGHVTSSSMQHVDLSFDA